MTQERRSLTLADAEWAALDALALSTESTAQRGPSPGQVSWRALIRRIAAGELVVARATLDAFTPPQQGRPRKEKEDD